MDDIDGMQFQIEQQRELEVVQSSPYVLFHLACQSTCQSLLTFCLLKSQPYQVFQTLPNSENMFKPRLEKLNDISNRKETARLFWVERRLSRRPTKRVTKYEREK